MRTAWMHRGGLGLVALLAFAPPAAADTTEAACVIHPKGSDHADATIPCSFSQRQGYVTITRSDGVTHDLSPTGDTAGRFVDSEGQPVQRDGGLGDQGLIFRLPEESVHVYWDTSMLAPADEGNPTAPFTTADYNATTLLRCKASADAEFGSCPAGILRMEDRQASIVVQDPDGDRFTINFLTDTVNATNREVEAELEGDLWTLRFGNGQVWQVPLAAIEGG